ncbi:hypothetical protein INT45_008250 [Circinella minor]|uniref:RRM domain-containing protein n=1 Tax=Circinella minor TaxID=1195481 RepID=A0A8H7S3W4_9FUNG|nr:hypothetical protein INT45_008250 [Circinella minor]
MTTKASSTGKTHQPTSAKTQRAAQVATASTTIPLHATGLMTPTSPPYPPYAGGFIDPAAIQVRPSNGYEEAAAAAAAHYHHHQGHHAHHHHPHHHHHHHPHQATPGGQATATAYVYPLSPQFQYYSDGGSSYPGSPAIHPQSPAMSPTSPPFSPPLLSPPMHPAYMIHHGHQQFSPLHITSPVLTGVPGSPPAPPPLSSAGSPPLPPGYLPALFDSRHLHKDSHLEYLEESQLHSHNIYVRGLGDTVTDESFEELCKSYGNVISSKAILDQKSGQCKGYGFAMYEKEDDCHRAIDDLNRRGLQASFARVGQESFSSRLRSLQDETSTNIYISNLPLDMSEQKLEALFHPCQTVSNRILRDPQSNLSRGVGFARLADRSSAVAIIEKFNGQSIPGSSAPLQVRFADSPAQKKLKNQTARKKMFRPPRDFQPMVAGFPPPSLDVAVSATAAVAAAAATSGRPMPITPEDMLGIAPMTNSASNNSNDNNNSSGYPPSQQVPASPLPATPHDRQSAIRSPSENENDDNDNNSVRELISGTEQLTVS